MSINPLIILSPILSIIIGLIPVIFFRPNGIIVFVSAIAYFLAIGLKAAIEFLSSNLISSSPIYLQALFYGSLTAIFEVGLAFLIPLIFHKYFVEYTKRKAISYGAMLAFWENAILIGLAGLINIITLLVLQKYNPTLIQQAIHLQPILAYSTSQLLPLIGLGALERVDSFLAHASWGSLAYYYLFNKSRKFFLIALLGYGDALAIIMKYGIISLELGEIILFAISLLAFIVSYKILP